MCVCVCVTVAEHVAVNMSKKRQVTTCVPCTAKFPSPPAKLNRKLEKHINKLASFLKYEKGCLYNVSTPNHKSLFYKSQNVMQNLGYSATTPIDFQTVLY
jgi:hypothetical protein